MHINYVYESLISRGCFGVSMEIGAVNLAKPGAVLCQKKGAVVSQLVPKLKESVPPLHRGCLSWSLLG